MTKHHYYVDITDCFSDWDIVLAGNIDAMMKSNIDADYTIIVPKKYTEQSFISYMPLALLRYIEDDMVKIYMIDTCNCEKSAHLITALVMDKIRQVSAIADQDPLTPRLKDHHFGVIVSQKSRYDTHALQLAAYALGYENVSIGLDHVKFSEINK